MSILLLIAVVEDVQRWSLSIIGLTSVLISYPSAP